eukprot:10471126-Heterocapsa_arctica.AAC.1
MAGPPRLSNPQMKLNQSQVKSQPPLGILLDLSAVGRQADKCLEAIGFSDAAVPQDREAPELHY